MMRKIISNHQYQTSSRAQTLLSAPVLSKKYLDIGRQENSMLCRDGISWIENRAVWNGSEHG